MKGRGEGGVRLKLTSKNKGSIKCYLVVLLSNERHEVLLEAGHQGPHYVIEVEWFHVLTDVVQGQDGWYNDTHTGDCLRGYHVVDLGSGGGG